MATIGQTLFRFTGALLLGASATSIDQPELLFAPVLSQRIATVPVVVASKDMPEGVIIDRTALVVAQWPAGTQPAGAYTSVDSVANRVSRVAIYKGEAIVPGRLAPEGTGAGLTVMLTPGKRAYGIRVNDVAFVAGMVQPNSRVDIMVIINDPEQGKQVAKLFMENMRVLAIGAAPESAQDGRPINAAVASIEVTPTEAERLAIAASQGTLQLVLRGDDVAQAAPAPALGGPRKPCELVNPGRAIVRDLLNRGCRVDELRFKKDSVAVRVVPPR